MAKSSGKPLYSPEQLEQLEQAYTAQLLTTAGLIFSAVEDMSEKEAATAAILLMEALLDELEGMEVPT